MGRVLAVANQKGGVGARSRLGWGEFAWRHLPVWLWIPSLRYSQ